MVTLEWDLERTDGVTLVRLFVESARECRVRIANRLDGPVWPPRRQGRPAAGWEDGEYTGVVPADGRLTVGYATTAEPADPPAEVVSTAAVDASDATDGTEANAGPTGRAGGGHGRTGEVDTAGATAVPAVEQTPDGVIRALGDPVVPRDCVPVPDARRSGDSRRRVGGSAGASGDAADATDATGVPVGRRPLLVPSAVRAWLRDVERRLDAVETRAAGADGGDGRRGSTGGEDHAAVVAAERRALAWVEQRVASLAARAVDREGR